MSYLYESIHHFFKKFSIYNFLKFSNWVMLGYFRLTNISLVSLQFQSNKVHSKRMIIFHWKIVYFKNAAKSVGFNQYKFYPNSFFFLRFTQFLILVKNYPSDTPANILSFFEKRLHTSVSFFGYFISNRVMIFLKRASTFKYMKV